MYDVVVPRQTQLYAVAIVEEMVRYTASRSLSRAYRQPSRSTIMRITKTSIGAPSLTARRMKAGGMRTTRVHNSILSRPPLVTISTDDVLRSC